MIKGVAFDGLGNIVFVDFGDGVPSETAVSAIRNLRRAMVGINKEYPTLIDLGDGLVCPAEQYGNEDYEDEVDAPTH